ncbi:MAG: class I tRNA ligase family protein [Candidatus Sungbacteria bacterium]|uniref:Isoleucine--tRNA ligase n=1 Tax=Candidatus Sungiibacteriota bacterium TaxID=2750080 RepID=A0A932VRE0_9BACT|nr:class I tRNA ligase family protein [Candidatus Sungbacteria bacterium]
MEKEKHHINLPEQEEEILKFWDEHKIFESSLARNRRGKPFVFYDGPPFATGLPHYGHILASVIKDVIPRFFSMRGRYVERRWGWDCHGLPLENLVEKELGLKTKKDIEAHGIAKFNQYAHDSVLRYAHDWKKIILRIGRWVDMEHCYRTMDPAYSETVWWIFKTLHERGLIYEGYKSMHVCPRCETTLANFEVSQGYTELTDRSVYVKFELRDRPGTYLLAWTTTPWTLPGNVALAVNPKIRYGAFKIEGHTYIAAKDLIPAIAGEHYTSGLVVRDVSASELVGASYKPMFYYYAGDRGLKNHENGWKIYPADFVTTEEGTGIVHIAPAFGEEDMTLGRIFNLPFVQHVAANGRFRPEVKDFAGLAVKPKGDHQVTDKKIIALLRRQGQLFYERELTHSYPLCWRCDTPLLNYAASSWFVNVQKIKKQLIANNKKVSWIPAHIRDGRFGKMLGGAPDWAISRSRYWGAPLPVWKCDRCRQADVVGSLKELDGKQGGARNRYLIMRHGQSLTNVQNMISRSPGGNYHLTVKGRAQVERAAKRLRKEGIDLVICSDVLRAKEAAEIVASALGAPLSTDERLREINTGIFDEGPAQRYDEYYGSQLDKFAMSPPEGESLNDVRKRMLGFLAQTDMRYQGKTILIVSHEHPLWMMEAGARGLSDEDAVLARQSAPGSVAIRCAEVKKMPYLLLPRNKEGTLDMHRPYIDSITFACSCGGLMRRIPEVFDCWFESGSMPYGQWHYPFENKQRFDPASRVGFPADFIDEGLDQTRGWFYSLLVLATALFGKSPYSHVNVHGTILAGDGQKMSKRLKNYPDPMEVVRRYGADALRLYLLSSSVATGEDLNFSLKDLDETYKKYSLILSNTLNFLLLYRPSRKKAAKRSGPGHVLDQWILSRLHRTIADVTSALESYELNRATKPLTEFVADLSLWYVRRSRERVKSATPEGASALATLESVLGDFARVAAPITPFLAETLYQRLGAGVKNSVHLEDWPALKRRLIKKDLERDMALVREIVSGALKLRAASGIKVRQPLRELRITNQELRKKAELLALIKDEVNVKEIAFGEEMRLDTAITPELKEEGVAREFVRTVQDMRRDMGLKPRNVIRCQISGSRMLEDVLERRAGMIKKDINAREFKVGGKKVFRAEREIILEGEKLWIGIS